MYTDYSAKYVSCPYEPVCEAKTFVAGLQPRYVTIDANDLTPGGLCNYEIRFPEGASQRAMLSLSIESLEGTKLTLAKGEDRLTAAGAEEDEANGVQVGKKLSFYPQNVYLTLQRDSKTNSPITGKWLIHRPFDFILTLIL